ncbi:MAG TPA: nuclear transport factor 2 family protein [Terriglobia bacterium]|nr:nuclear transport factor 2 family protein [Terriglobia bacterium]
MRRQIVGMLVAVALIAAVRAVPRSMPQSSNADDTVSQLVQAWLNAESEGDTTALDKLIADDFIGTGPGGNILNKSDIVPPAGGERPKMPKSRVKESSVRLFGTTAVAMGSVVYETLPQPGFRFTLVFLNRGQGWQMIAAHLATVPTTK